RNSLGRHLRPWPSPPRHVLAQGFRLSCSLCAPSVTSSLSCCLCARRQAGARAGCWVGGATLRSDVGGERLDRIDDRVEPSRAEQVEAVLRAGQLCVDDRIRRRGAQLLDEATGVFDDDEGVPVTVRDEERWCV